MEIKIAKNYGFCAGVKNALEIVNKTVLTSKDKKIYMLNKIVHNQNVIEQIKNLGVIILDDSSLTNEEKIKSISDGILIFSAHGHDKKLDLLAKKQNLEIVDTTCKKVLLNIKQIQNALLENKDVVYIGIRNHPETEASLAISDKIIFLDFFSPDYSKLNNLKHISIHNQTTLIQDDLIKIYTKIKQICQNVEVHNDICFATSLRQKSLLEVTDEDLIIIIGDKISSNSTRLYEVGKSLYPNRTVLQINSLEELTKFDLSKYKKGFITAGASTPDEVINPIVKYLQNY